MKELYLRNCNNVYYKKDNKRKYSVYHDPINNNLIVFSPFDDCDIDSVCGAIRDSAYQYLINELNTKKNIIVSWSEVSGTTSDYTIYYNMDIDTLKEKSHDEILNIVYNSIANKNDCIGYKYTKVIDEKEIKIIPEEMINNNV
jgi:hypothetical protein